MSWESFVEAQVRLAMGAGEFKDLRGAGEPIRGLDEPYRDDWWLREYLKREELSAPCASLDIRAEVERCLTTILKLPTESAVRRHLEALNDKIAKVNRTVIHGPSTSVAKLDIHAVVTRWQSQRHSKNADK
jgi:hypothetical protein